MRALRSKKEKPVFLRDMRKNISILLILFLILSTSCKVIYPNRTPVIKPKRHYGWYKPKFKKRKRTKVVWMKVHKGKFKKEAAKSAPSPTPETPNNQE